MRSASGSLVQAYQPFQPTLPDASRVTSLTPASTVNQYRHISQLQLLEVNVFRVYASSSFFWKSLEDVAMFGRLLESLKQAIFERGFGCCSEYLLGVGQLIKNLKKPCKCWSNISDMIFSLPLFLLSCFCYFIFSCIFCLHYFFFMVF